MSRVAVYVIGKHGTGWACSSCRRNFAHNGKPRRTFLALLDHVVLDHHRLPKPYSKATVLRPVTWTSGTSQNYGVAYTLTSIRVTPLEADRGSR